MILSRNCDCFKWKENLASCCSLVNGQIEWGLGIISNPCENHCNVTPSPCCSNNIGTPESHGKGYQNDCFPNRTSGQPWVGSYTGQDAAIQSWWSVTPLEYSWAWASLFWPLCISPGQLAGRRGSSHTGNSCPRVVLAILLLLPVRAAGSAPLTQSFKPGWEVGEMANAELFSVTAATKGSSAISPTSPLCLCPAMQGELCGDLGNG